MYLVAGVVVLAETLFLCPVSNAVYVEELLDILLMVLITATLVGANVVALYAVGIVQNTVISNASPLFNFPNTPKKIFRLGQYNITIELQSEHNDKIHTVAEL